MLQEQQQHGFDWLVGVNVGFEDANLDVANMNQLRSQIFDVRGMMSTVSGANAVPVGHIDQFSGWSLPGMQE